MKTLSTSIHYLSIAGVFLLNKLTFLFCKCQASAHFFQPSHKGSLPAIENSKPLKISVWKEVPNRYKKLLQMIFFFQFDVISVIFEHMFTVKCKGYCFIFFKIKCSVMCVLLHIIFIKNHHHRHHHRLRH